MRTGGIRNMHLNSRIFYATTRYYGGKGFSRSLGRFMSTTVIDTVDTDADILAHLRDIKLFPWRETPNNFEPFKELWRYASIVQVGLLITFLQVGGDSFMKMSDLSTGAKIAFQGATEGIFDHKLMVPHRKQLSAQTENEKETEPAPLLADMFSSDLKKFYQYAIEQHCIQNKKVCHYNLEEILKVSLRDMQWYVGAPNNVTGLGTSCILPGLNYFNIHSIVSTLGPMASFSEYMKTLERYVDTEKCILRVTIDIECKEVFAIKDVSTDTVVQGTLQPKTVTHRLLLENTISLVSFSQNSGWVIADLDDWLQGNRYWLKDHLAKLSPPTDTPNGNSGDSSTGGDSNSSSTGSSGGTKDSENK